MRQACLPSAGPKCLRCRRANARACAGRNQRSSGPLGVRVAHTARGAASLCTEVRNNHQLRAPIDAPFDLHLRRAIYFS
eukprot:3678110-Lingulodinium_polyedra.AAC.1